MPKVRFLILSDTHTHPLFPSTDLHHAYRRPLPKADVLLHCGDLTMKGGLEEYHTALDMLRSAEAELKLVIAGNHDLTLDGEYWRTKRMSYREDPGDHAKAVEMWKGGPARRAGVTYLEEGTYEFTLGSGATFTIHASPYTPEFCNWAFPYPHKEDRFNPTSPSTTSTSTIPDFPAIDILMTHGPPHTHLDLVSAGPHRNLHVGCPHLLHAVQRARPRLHCFGHIHEGWGAEMIRWNGKPVEDDDGEVAESGEGAEVERVQRVEVVREEVLRAGAAAVDVGAGEGGLGLVFGESTLMVNAAVMTVRYRAENAPWVVEMELPAR